MSWVGWLAVALVVPSVTLFSWTQTARIVLTRTAAGVSAPTFVMSAAVSALWVVYGIVADDLLNLAVSSVSGVGSVAVVVLAVRANRDAAWRTFGWVAACAAGVGAAVYGGAPTVAVVASALAAVALWPQVAAVWAAADIAGVSVGAFALRGVAGVGWVSHGIARGDVWVVLPALFLIPASIAICVKVAVRRAQPHGRHAGTTLSARPAGVPDRGMV